MQARSPNTGVCSMYCFDCFSSPMGFGVDDGKYRYSSGWGCCLSLLCILFATLYASEKLFVQTQLTSYSITSVFDPEYKFGTKDGFNIAFAFTPYGGDMSKDISSDKHYKVEAELYRWSIPEGATSTTYDPVPLKLHTCTKDELGVPDDNPRDENVARFYPIKEYFVRDVKRMVGNLLCIDEEQEWGPDFDLYGFFDAEAATSVHIRLLKCD